MVKYVIAEKTSEKREKYSGTDASCAILIVLWYNNSVILADY